MSAGQLPSLDTFAKAAELNSFTAAAKALGLTQAAVSQRIQALERVLGCPLFRREGGHVLLTEAGRRLHPFARQILDLHCQAVREVTGCQSPLAGELSLAASSVPGEHLLPDLLSVFQKRYPHVRVKATVADSRAALDRVEQGEANLGLVGGKGDSEHLEYRRLASDQLVLVVPAEHPWGRLRRVPLGRLGAAPLVLREAGSGSRWCLERALQKAGTTLRELRVALELGSNEAIVEAVRRGLGLAILSARVVRKEVEAARLRTVPVAGLSLVRELLVVRDRRRVLPAPARLFLDLLEGRHNSR